MIPNKMNNNTYISNKNQIKIKIDNQQGYNPNQHKNPNANMMNQHPNPTMNNYPNQNYNPQFEQPKKERLRVKMTQEEK